MTKKRVVNGVLGGLVSPALRRLPGIRKAVSYLSRAASEDSYFAMREHFVANGRSGAHSTEVRRKILRRFEAIDDAIELASTPAEGLALAEALLSLEVPGDVIECGCFNGGSTAKLSIVARLTGRKLFVFDSFEGLPETDEFNKRDLNARMSTDWSTEWSPGRYAAGLDAVKANIGRLGELDVCSFQKGWFSQTLGAGALPPAVAMAFVDVDIPSSARECFVPIWPRLAHGGVFFLHDVGFIKLLQTLLDEKLWTEELREFPPILFGAGYGLSDDASTMGYLVKGKGLTAEYIKNLTLAK